MIEEIILQKHSVSLRGRQGASSSSLRWVSVTIRFSTHYNSGGALFNGVPFVGNES